LLRAGFFLLTQKTHSHAYLPEPDGETRVSRL
jgi:hypothetical protein